MQRTVLVLCIAALLCATVLAAPVAAATTTETFQADADAYIRWGSGPGNTNYGTSTSLYVRQSGDPWGTSAGTLYRSLIHFNLSAIPEDATIESATLYGYLSARTGDREVAAYRVTGEWTESGVTWNNAPSNATQPTNVTDPGSSTAVWIGWNVMHDVQAYVQGTANNGWLLTLSNESATSEEQRVQLTSRDSTDSTQRPYLNVTYSTGGAAPVLTTISVSPATADLTAGATQQFTATAKDQDNNEMSGVTFTWTSGNETVGTVNETGYFTALVAGTTTVTAAAEGVNGTTGVTVTPAAQIDLTIAGVVNPSPGTAVFAREPNRVQVRSIQNTGTETATNIVVALYASDVANGTVAINTTTIESLAGGAQIAITTIVDPTIRNLQGGTVRYTAIVDPDNLIGETDETNNVKVGFADKNVLYNGYKGKMYWDGGSNVTTVRTYDLRGDIIHSFGDSQYVSGSFGGEGWTNYTVTWTAGDLPLPAGATVHDAWLYVPYCWDNTNSAPDNVSIDFNGVQVPYVNWYHDVSNFGAYKDHMYGLMTYNVTSLYKAGANNTALFTREGADAKISPAGFTLAVIYEDASATRKQIFVNEEFDILGADEGNYGTSMEEATAYVPFSGAIIDTGSVARANLTTFVPWGNDGEGNLYFNGDRIGMGVWNYGPRAVGASDNPQVAADEREVTAYLNATGNEAAIQGDNTWKSPCMVAAQTFLVVEYADEATVPVANFTANVTSGDAPLAVQFTDTSTNAPISWLWDFGDNETSAEQNATHTYTAAGTYTVNLTVTNADGSDSEVKTGYITVTSGGSGGDAPVAAFTATPLIGPAPLSVTFTDASSNSPTAWSWESRPSGTDESWTTFSADRNATYTFESGAYDIRLTASNAYGNDTVTKTQYISSSAGAKRLATVQNGTVSGDLYVGAYGGWSSGTSYTTNTFNQTFTLPAYTDVQWARLYTVVYAAGTDNRTGTATVRFDGNGDGTYDTLGTETLATAGDNTVNVYPVNDHVSRQYSDYLLWYDVTDLVGSQSAKAEVVSTPVASNFDGRIKELVLVVAYNDGNGDEVHYWVNDGHDYQANGAGGVTSTFATGGLTAGWTDATLQNVMLSSKDALYTFNGAAYTGENSTGYFGTNTWDVRNNLTAGSDSSFSYVPNGGSYKTTLATLAVKYPASGGDAPVANFTADVTSGTAPLAVQFTDTSTGSPTSWIWDFGDNATSTEQNATHTYTAAGTYTVSLTATNAAGSDDEVKTDYITVSAAAQVDLTIAGTVNPVPASAVFAREPNPVRIMNVKNTGADAAANITIALYASDVANGTVAINTTTIETLASGATSTVTLLDPTIRDLEGSTVTYTAVVDPDNRIAETNEANNNKTSPVKNVRYNGYKGKGIYWDGGSNITTKQTFDLRGGIVYAAQPAGAYKAVSWTDRTETWTADDLPVPAGATVEKVYLYVAYNWDQTEAGVPNMTVTFNGNVVALGTPYLDKSNFGAYADYEYGLYPAVDVTSLFVRDGNNTLVMTPDDGNKQALYPSTLAVVYSDPSATRKQIFLNEECDELGYSETSYGTTLEEATAYVPFSGMTVDVANVKNATLHSFVGSAGPDEGNLLFNGATVATNAWMGTASTCEAQAFDVTAHLTADGNEAGIQGTTSGGMCAYHQFLVVEYADAALPDLTVSTLAPNSNEVFSASENTYTAKITNIGTADAGAFAVEFNVSGVTGTVAVPDSLAAGANTTVTWTDETVREAGDNVTVTATADPENSIVESNEENNLLCIEKTVVANGYRGKRWTGGDDLNTAKTYDVRGDLLWSAGDGAYLSAGTNWAAYTVNWTAADLPIPGNATIAGARLYVPYTYDKGPVFPENVALTFNGAAVEQAAFYADEKMWGTSYPYGMTVYDVTDAFSTEGNAATLANTFPGGGNVSVRGMLLAVVYDDGTAAPHTVLINEGFDLLYGGAAQGTTPEQATAYAPFSAVETADAVGATLVTVAPGAGPAEAELIFNDETWTNVWNYTGTTQIGVDERNVTSFLAGENVAAFRSSGDYMEAAATFLVVEYAPEPGSIAVASTPAGAAVWLDGADTGLATPITLENVPPGDRSVTLKLDGYADASTPVTVLSGETATVDLALTTLTGSLAVTSTPDGAAILIDGADTGQTTNATLDGIAVGTHTVTLRKDGYADASAGVTIADNETATLHLDLVEARGSIAVASTPTGAAIWLDGTETGETTNALLENVPAGDHVVTVKKAGYADASRTVTVLDNETATVNFLRIEPAGSIVVTSTPDGARVYLDDVETGEVTNATLTNVPVGTHTVRVSLDGYLDAEEAVTVASGEIASVHFDLDAASITLQPGWNFVSTPKRLADGQDTIAIFDGVNTDGRPVLYYNGANQWEALSREEAFRPLDGIWIYANGTYEIPLAFAAASNSPPTTKDLDEGWNAIGFSDTVPEPAVTTLRSVETTWATLFGFNAAEQEYDVSIIRGATGRHGEERTVTPTQGYWLYMNEADTLAAIGA